MATASARRIYLEVLQTEAKNLKLDWKVLDAIIHIESSWNPWVVRFEKNFTYTQDQDKFAKLNRITVSTEHQLQKFSWGLMQVMGGTARWLGYAGALTALCDVDVNIYVGAKYFHHLCGQYVKLSDQIAAYNAGSVRLKADKTYVNQAYVDKVLKIYNSIE